MAGATLSLVVDEGLNPLLGFTARPSAYPVATHLRGLAGHLVYGLALAGTTELAWRLIRATPGR